MPHILLDIFGKVMTIKTFDPNGYYSFCSLQLAQIITEVAISRYFFQENSFKRFLWKDFFQEISFVIFFLRDSFWEIPFERFLSKDSFWEISFKRCLSWDSFWDIFFERLLSRDLFWEILFCEISFERFLLQNFFREVSFKRFLLRAQWVCLLNNRVQKFNLAMSQMLMKTVMGSATKNYKSVKLLKIRGYITGSI